MAYNRWLLHSGRLGMKWGERNGPPYPLSRQKRFSSNGKKVSDRVYLQVTTRKYEHKRSTEPKSKPTDGKRWMFREINADYSARPKLGEVKKRTLQDYKNIKDVQKYEQSLETRLTDGRNFLAKTKILGFRLSRALNKTKNELPLKSRETTKDEDLKMVNPTCVTNTISGSNNCLLCTVGYDMRRRGYNVMAKQYAPIEYLWDISTPDFTYLYNGTKEVKSNTLYGIEKKLSRLNNGNSRGALACTWNGAQSGHCVAYEAENGKVTIYDAQDGTKYDDLADLFSDAHNFRAIRLDNLEPNYSLIKLAID